MSFLSDIFDFERLNLREIGRKLKEDPERLLLGGITPFDTKVQNKILGRDDKPLVGQWGGPAESTWERAAAEGVNLGPNELMHGIAQSIASMYAMNWGKGKIKSYGQKQGWNPDIVDQGIRMAEGMAKGAGQQPAQAPPPPPAFPPRERISPAFAAAPMPPGAVRSASGAPGAAQTPGARPVFPGPTPTPPRQPRRA